MALYQHIMLAVDFSEHTALICQRAQSMAELYQARLSICHIIEDLPITDFAYEPMISVDIDMRNTLLESGKEQLSQLAATLNIPIEDQWAECGTPSHNVVTLANDNHVDLIVIGSQSRHGLKALLGSTAKAVLNNAQCDVLAVNI